jgi:uncharacterized protein (TIGR02300 family)
MNVAIGSPGLCRKLDRPGHHQQVSLALHTGDSSLSKPAWGAKRVCQSCGVKFYDFSRTPIVCPKCGTQFDPEVLLKSRRPRASAAKPAKAAAPVKPKQVEEEDDDIDLGADDDDLAELPDEDEDGDTVIEDTSDLGEDDDDVSKAVVPSGGEED